MPGEATKMDARLYHRYLRDGYTREEAIRLAKGGDPQVEADVVAGMHGIDQNAPQQRGLMGDLAAVARLLQDHGVPNDRAKSFVTRKGMLAAGGPSKPDPRPPVGGSGGGGGVAGMLEDSQRFTNPSNDFTPGVPQRTPVDPGTPSMLDTPAQDGTEIPEQDGPGILSRLGKAAGSDMGLRAIEAAAGAGGMALQGRAQDRINKRNVKATSRANLMNALRGNIVATAPNEEAAPGLGQSALAGVQAGVAGVREQRAEDLKTKLAKAKQDGTLDEHLGDTFEQVGLAAIGRDKITPEEVQALRDNPESALRNRPNLLRRFQQGTPNQRQAWVGRMLQGVNQYEAPESDMGLSPDLDRLVGAIANNTGLPEEEARSAFAAMGLEGPKLDATLMALRGLQMENAAKNETGMSNTMLMQIASMDALPGILDVIESNISQAKFSGPGAGNLWRGVLNDVPLAGQLLDEFAKTVVDQEPGHAVLLAVALQGARPSDAEKEATLAMMPKLSDSPAVRSRKIVVIRSMMEARKEALKAAAAMGGAAEQLKMGTGEYMTVGADDIPVFNEAAYRQALRLQGLDVKPADVNTGDPSLAPTGGAGINVGAIQI